MDGMQKIINDFHKLYYDTGAWEQTYWFGTRIYKCPLDMWLYQEIIFRVKPDVIIETGTWQGGSALYFAHLLDILGKGHIYTIDIEEGEERPEHNRITYILGSSTNDNIVKNVKSKINPEDKVLVILDSDHSRDHVLNEMNIYHSLVTTGSYMIVEDTNINGHPVREDFGPGPMEAVDEFLNKVKGFEIDDSMHKFYMTLNPRGYLKKN